MAKAMRQTEMRCRRKLREPKVPCVCGCGKTASNFFRSGHDRKLDAAIGNNTKDATKDVDKLARADWCNVPLCFFGGKHADVIRDRRAGKDCSRKWELTQEPGRPPCHLD